jgi:hypothetical protein
LCIKLAIKTGLYYDARSEKHQNNADMIQNGNENDENLRHVQSGPDVCTQERWKRDDSISGTKIITYADQLVMLCFLTEGGLDWEVHFDREDKSICWEDFLERVIGGSIWKHNIKIRLWEIDILQLLITATNITWRFGGIRPCDEAIMLISAKRVSLNTCGMHSNGSQTCAVMGFGSNAVNRQVLSQEIFQGVTCMPLNGVPHIFKF